VPSDRNLPAGQAGAFIRHIVIGYPMRFIRLVLESTTMNSCR
jgi:hypothetical protein